MNPSKAKGTAGETRVLRYLKAAGFTSAHRKVLAGSKDTGDLQVTPWLIAEVKTHRTFTDGDLARWLIETEVEQGNAGMPEAILIVVRHRQPLDRAWVVQRDGHGYMYLMHLKDWAGGYNR